MTNLLSLRKRVALLEQHAAQAGGFMGSLDFDPAKETLEEVVRRVSIPGLYLVVAAGTDEGYLCSIRSDRSFEVLFRDD